MYKPDDAHFTLSAVKIYLSMSEEPSVSGPPFVRTAYASVR